jgi:uncharacterized membrane protein YkvA (DUF1232 family)
MSEEQDSKATELIFAQVATMKEWLGSYKQDVETMRDVMLDEGPHEGARRLLAGALSYQLKDMDLIPDWVPGVGRVDDAMVLRVAAAAFMERAGDLPKELSQRIKPLADDLGKVKEILGDLFPLFEALVARLPDEKMHGRRADTILKREAEREHFLKDLAADIAQHKPRFSDDSESYHRQVLSHLRSKLK